MKICAIHWSAMRKKVDDLGLSPFVAGSGEEALARTVANLERVAQTERPPDKENWDPLMSMNWNFIAKAMNISGLGILSARRSEDGMPANDGQYCPLCVARASFDAHNTATGRCLDSECTVQINPGESPWDDLWIGDCGDAMFDHAIAFGLIQRQ